MKAYTVKVKTPDGEQVVEVRATGTQDAARKAQWYFLPGTAEVLWVEPVKVAQVVVDGTVIAETRRIEVAR